MSTSDFHSLPSFIQNNINDFWENRYHKEWGGKHILKGRPLKENDLLLNHNDYLNTAKKSALIQKTRIPNLDTNSTMMSSVFHLNGHPQNKLEAKLSNLLDSEECILTQSGYSANIGLLQAIANPDTPIFIDILAHTSLWEGVHAARATAQPFAHNDLNHLEKKLSSSEPGIIIVDSIYSTDGSIAPLREITKLALTYECALIVDESHSLGTHGPNGAGLVVDLELQNKVTFRTASLAKAFCSRSGLITLPSKAKTFIQAKSFPNIFSSSLLESDIDSLNLNFEIITSNSLDRERSHLKQISNLVRCEAESIGYNIPSNSQIISPEPGTYKETMKLRDYMESRGIIGAIFCPPATPKNRACLRLSLHSEVTLNDAEKLIEILKTAYKDLDGSNWRSSRRRRSCFTRPKNQSRGPRKFHPESRTHIYSGLARNPTS